MAHDPLLPTTPHRFEEAFLDDLPYHPEVLFLDELTRIDVERSEIVCRMPTDGELPLMNSQRTHPVRHPRHVAGAVMVHATGMLGFVHAYYLLGLRHHEGWVGYGTHVHKAAFRKLVEPGVPIIATCRATRVRKGARRFLVRYLFEFTHDGEICYEGDQSAVWMLTGDAGDAAAQGSGRTSA